MGRHIIEQAKARVVIEDGKIIEVSEPPVKKCPLHMLMYGPDTVHTKDFIRRHVEWKIKHIGMFTPNRVIESIEDLVPFGASEILMSAMAAKLIDCSVLACDGAGTVLATTPQLTQGIGGWMAGLIKTSPIPEVIERIEAVGGIVLDRKKAKINQVKGVKLAFEKGFRKVAVTVIGSDSHVLPKLRRIERKFDGTLAILMVHTTGVSKWRARTMAKHADLVWACASKHVRQIVGPKSLIQLGVGIPVYVLTRLGKKLIANRIVYLKQKLLIQRKRLPYNVWERQPQPLI